MFLALYFLALIISVAFFYNEWKTHDNKLQPLLGFIVAVLPILNVVEATIIVLELVRRFRNWKGV